MAIADLGEQNLKKAKKKPELHQFLKEWGRGREPHKMDDKISKLPDSQEVWRHGSQGKNVSRTVNNNRGYREVK